MISVIIPALNEEATIGKLVSFLSSDPESKQWITEILVVDGGSDDETRNKAKDAGANLINSEPGRARQMNRGAELASGSILYFLHADTFPPAGFARKIINAIDSGFRAGCFQLAFDTDHPLMRFYGWCTRFDLSWFRFGDQSLFITRDDFEQNGGFDSRLMVMEDNEFIRRIKKHIPFKVLEDRVITSSRKYHEVGVVKLQLLFTSIVILYEIGVSQKVLADWYKTVTSW